MKSVLLAVGLLLVAMCLCSQARTNDLQTAVSSFPQLPPQVYHPGVAARCANALIQAGEEKACAALLKAVSDRRQSVNMQACHLCRLLFTSTNTNQALR